jgi:hypothetical protein
MQSNNTITHSQAQCQVAHANAKPKPAIELVYLPTLILPTLKQLNLLKMVTKAKIKRADSANLKALQLINFIAG